MSSHLRPAFPIPPVKYRYAEGPWIYGEDDKRYFDASSGAVCVNIGHRHPVVLEAIQEQLTRCTYVHPAVFLNDMAAELADALCSLIGQDLQGVMFSTTGTSANELAVALARQYHREQGEPTRVQILTSWLGYHGSSAYLLALSGHRRRRLPLAHCAQVAPSFAPPYQGFHDSLGEAHTCSAACADEVALLIDRLGPREVAAVLIEPVVGATGGVMVPPAGYLAKLRQHCEQAGVLLIYDEVLVGLGRCGTPLASDMFPASTPDITVISKGIHAGYTALSAVLVNEKVAAVLRSPSSVLPMAGTLAENPLSIAIGRAVLKVLENLGVFDSSAGGERFRQTGKTLGEHLVSALSSLPCVKDIRGEGYLYGIEVSEGLLPGILADLRQRGLILYPFNGFRPGGKGEGIVVAPPLTCSANELYDLVGSLHASLLSFS